MYTLRLLSVFSFMLNTSAFSYNPEPVAIYYFSPKTRRQLLKQLINTKTELILISVFIV